jgi:hypothetical protein
MKNRLGNKQTAPGIRTAMNAEPPEEGTYLDYAGDRRPAKPREMRASSWPATPDSARARKLVDSPSVAAPTPETPGTRRSSRKRGRVRRRRLQRGGEEGERSAVKGRNETEGGVGPTAVLWLGFYGSLLLPSVFSCFFGGY